MVHFQVQNEEDENEEGEEMDDVLEEKPNKKKGCLPKCDRIEVDKKFDFEYTLEVNK